MCVFGQDCPALLEPSWPLGQDVGTYVELIRFGCMYVCMAQDTCEYEDQDQGQDQYSLRLVSSRQL